MRLLVDVFDDEDDPGALQVFWDDDYDGVWDAGPDAADVIRQLTFNATGMYTLKVRVVDTGGLTAQGLVVVQVHEPEQEPEPGSDSGCGSRATPMSAPGALAWVLLLGLLWLCRRRRWTAVCGDVAEPELQGVRSTTVNGDPRAGGVRRPPG